MFGWAIVRNYSTNKGLTKLFKECLDSGIESVNIEGCRTRVKFSNQYTVVFWTVNKMYAYASDGIVYRPDGTATSWSSEMPSRSINCRLEKAVSVKSFL